MGCYDDNFCRIVTVTTIVGSSPEVGHKRSEPIFTTAHIKISLQYRHGMQLNINNIHNDRNIMEVEMTLKNQHA